MIATGTLTNAPWIAERLRQMDMAWREHVPDPWDKHLYRLSEAHEWMGIPIYLPADTPGEIVAARDEALRLALDYWEIAHVDWRLRNDIPLRRGDPTTREAVTELLAPIIPPLREATARFRALWAPRSLAASKVVARQRTLARRKPRQGTIARPPKPIEEMSLEEYLDHLFPKG